MLIKTKYIDCASKSAFNTWKLPTSAADTSGDIYWSAVVYIKDTGEVWTHGKLYGGFFSNADNNKVSLTIGGTTKILALDGHVQSYTTLTGSGSTADQAILSTGEANKWTLKTLGKNAFSNVDYLPADATAVAAEKVVHALAFQYNGKAIHSFDGSVARVLNIIQGDNVFITGDSQGNVTIAADPGGDTVNTAGATNKVDTKLFLIGAESQTTAPQTYSNQYVYIGTDNCLYSLGKKVLTEQHASAFSYKSWWHWSGQSGQPTWLWGGNSENSYYVYNPSNFNVNSATYAHKVRGEYTEGGGQQNPNYFGTNWVGFRMMNTTVGTDSQYKDWIISDCYSGNGVGGAVAFGMNRQSLGAYLMGSDSNRKSWTRKGTFWGDWNLDPVTKSQLKKTRVPGEVVDFYVYQVNGYTCTSTDYTTFRNQLFDSSGRGKSSVSYKATSSSMTYTVNLSDFVLAYNGIGAYGNGMYTAGGGEIESNRIGSTAGANSKTITGYEMPKHAHWFGRCRSDNANDRDVFGPDGGQNHSTNGTTSAGQGGNWRTGYSGNGQSKDWRPKTIFVFKMVYAPQSW